jgi:HlyD family secretion protein
LSNSQYDAAKAHLEAATADREVAEQVLKRAESGTPEEELNEARSAHKAAEASLRLLLTGTRREDIAAAEARLKQARAVLDELRNGARRETIAAAQAAARASIAQKLSLERLITEDTLFAPGSGIVERILVAKGDLLQPGAPAIRLSDPTEIWLRVFIPEVSLAKVRVGDEAELRIDGIHGSLQAIVEAIASQGEFTPANLQTPDERAKQVFAVKLRLVRPDTRVKAGMYATVKRMGRWP